MNSVSVSLHTYTQKCTHESLFLSSVTKQYGTVGYLTNVYPIRCANDILLASSQEEPQVLLNTLNCVNHEFGLLINVD